MSKERNRHVCVAAASRSPSPVTTTRAASPCWTTSTAARLQSRSTRNTVRRASPSVAASADGVKPSQNALLVVSDHGPRTATVVS
jgi:hypothetical protein